MTYTVLVLYPNQPDAKFDVEYYTKTHMPLVAKHFGEYGFKGYRFSSLKGTADPATPSPYSVQCLLTFNDAKGFQDAFQNAAGPVLGDIPNFTNTQPILIHGDEHDNTTQ